MAQHMNMDPATWRAFLWKFGKVVREMLARGEPVGIPGVCAFYVHHIYGKTHRGKVVPHRGRPKSLFSPSIKRLTQNAPNKGTPSELLKFKSKPVEAPSPNARRRSELPGGYYLHRSRALASVRQTGLGPQPSRGRTARAQTGFVERMTELDVHRRFKVSIKRAAKAAGQDLA